ncbi:aldehyde dehydrogenase (NADP(+)) [Pontibacter amylolyticus]|uniref:2,5-dioxovalerate dehydrogenase n=1 Tax=Pontibacter amylolyticus TaxID=1424080 RepID=A0ABQ1WFS8_9BACT|nr:aldehyde dehydrogenase (NADP(+)) [Pontibacter amylolyticus]GGG27978.1 2,5-dioxovalerate dehydrogenase [Pontibacter amylolyticus]
MPYNEALINAAQAFESYKKTTPAQRTQLLRGIAEAIEALEDELLETASRESNLPLARLTGERGRTCNQLRLFADLVEEGSWVEATIDTALPDRQPLPRPDLRRMLVPLGPVVVFGASNFPLAFSTAGGDTASALAAGCTVVYKEHPGHPKTSQLVHKAITQALQANGLPEGVFQHVSGGIEVGQELVKHPATKAVAFTGSYQGGKAIFDLAMQREVPIPVYAEMGSTNPIFILPERLMENTAELAHQAAASVLLGAGQFCTCPGLLFVPESAVTAEFMETLEAELATASPAKMLHDGIAGNYYKGLKELLKAEGVQALVQQEADVLEGRAALASTSAAQWLQNPALQEEVFGPFTLVVRYSNASELISAAKALQGQLTCTLWGSDQEHELQQSLMDVLREKCGRLLFSGVPTGVEVSHAMTHGGPFPATTDSRSTSVGTYAIKRFARPVTFQSAPQTLLPVELQDENHTGLWRTINGKLSQSSL